MGAAEDCVEAWVGDRPSADAGGDGLDETCDRPLAQPTTPKPVVRLVARNLRRVLLE
ncbi:MAG: hypothetical protein ACFCBU_08410 [Cyanophyceae cyanobacterium]